VRKRSASAINFNGKKTLTTNPSIRKGVPEQNCGMHPSIAPDAPYRGDTAGAAVRTQRTRSSDTIHQGRNLSRQKRKGSVPKRHTVIRGWLRRLAPPRKSRPLTPSAQDADGSRRITNQGPLVPHLLSCGSSDHLEGRFFSQLLSRRTALGGDCGGHCHGFFRLGCGLLRLVVIGIRI
jgi:hypothetical protein